MKKYESLDIELVRFDAEDVIATSAEETCDPMDDVCEKVNMKAD